MDPVGVASRRLSRIAALVLAVLATAVLTTAATARSTVVSPGFYRSVLDEQKVYDRLYNQVLVDPKTAAVTRGLLARLPVPEAQVTSNLKLVLPPETVRDLTQQQINAVVGYLGGKRDSLDLTVDLRPVLANLNDLAQIYFGDLVASVQDRPEPDFERFSTDLSTALGAVVAGHVPGGLPALPLTGAQAEQAAGTLVSGLPVAERDALRPAVEAALRDGDVATALATVAPAVVSDRTRTAAAQLRATVGGTWNLTDTLAASGNDLAPLHRARTYTAVGLGLAEALASALLLVALVVLWVGGGSAPPGRRLLPLGWSLAAGGVLAALIALLFRLVSGGRVIDPPGSWPPSLARLVDDVQRTALDRLTTTALTTALVPVLAGALLTGVGWALQVRPHVPALPRIRWLALATGGAAVAGVLLVPYAVTPAASRTCEGSAQLCDRSYDEVAYLTSHNAMSTTVDRFIGPLQDPGISAQLDDGVRALQIDTYRWELPDEITQRLAESDFTPEQRKFIAAAVDRFNPPREGLWLCHSVCRAGAIALVPALREIGDWMRAHPTEVVTLIVQDAISGEDTQQAFAQAGLTDLVHTPDPDPAKPWPSLGDMIDSGRRLVVFAERADGPAPWYRNFYDYGMETPFAFRTPDAMSCVPHRGGTDKRLFLLNHFVTIDGGSRLDAGKVNARQYVLDRVHRCERERGRPVNFVAVDYTTIGDAGSAVDELNSQR
ncbi:PI-PLC domain-containing protein [Streptomyces xylophagus]|uniref:membrane protein n=1 Tax=Streptomyces xylophagus TaxID=285514 RepID=UPI0005BA8506|nr:membrane protein [Streptomyces xylophagus]